VVVFFLFYMVITMLFLKNTLLGSVYDSYKNALKISLSNFEGKRLNSINHAFFHLQDEQGLVQMRTWLVFFKSYCHPRHEIATLVEARADNVILQRTRHMFEALDLWDGVKTRRGLNDAEFSLVCEVLCDTSFKSLQRRGRSRGTVMLRLCRCSVSWDLVVDFFVLLELIVACAQTVRFTYHFDDTSLRPSSWYSLVLCGFSVLFAFDVSWRMWLDGVRGFWRSFQNRFDFFTVFTLFCGSIAVFFFENTTLLRTLVLLRMARIEKLMARMGTMQRLAVLVTRLTESYAQITLLLAIIFYAFAIFGVEVFGGLIDRRNPHLEGSVYAQSDYWTLNWNDIPSALVSLFALMIANNWCILADAIMRVSSNWAIVYFVSFYVVTHHIALNILMALILDVSAKFDLEMTQDEKFDRAMLSRAQDEGLGESQVLKPRQHAVRKHRFSKARLLGGILNKRESGMLDRVQGHVPDELNVDSLECVLSATFSLGA